MNKNNLIKQSIILILIAVVFSGQIYGQSPKNETFAFTHVNVIPMNKEIVLKDYTVIVKNDKITKMGSSSLVMIPKGTTIINAKGKYIIPGLSDMHVHLEGEAWNLMFPEGSKHIFNDSVFADILFLYLANGVTTIEILSALPDHVALRNKINTGEIQGPRMILSRMIDGPDKAWPPPISTWVKNSTEAKKAVKEAHSMGYDRMKVYSFLSKDSYDAVLSTAKELNMGVDGHVPMSLSVEYVLQSGQNSIVHSEEILKFAGGDFSKDKIKNYAKSIAESNTWITPTLITSNKLISLFNNSEKVMKCSESKYSHPMAKGIWSFIYNKLYKPISENTRKSISNGYDNFQKYFTYEFHKAGGKILTGTDALLPGIVHGFSLHDELKELVDVGISPFETLKASTTNSHEFLGEIDKEGTIETGKKANLVLLDANPLDDISNTKKIYGVMSQNKWISKKEIETRLKEISKLYNKSTTIN